MWPFTIFKQRADEREAHAIRASRYFDPDFYARTNPDVAGSGQDLALHYVRHGWREGRDPSAAFSVSWYLRQHDDVNRERVDPLRHYLRYGQAEGRSIAPSGTAAPPGPDEPGTRGLDDRTLVERSGFFDPVFYRSHGFVAAEGPLDHYLRAGWTEARRPSARFNPTSYVQHNPDVAAAGVNPLIHYLRFGVLEGRGAGVTLRSAAIIGREMARLAEMEGEIATDPAMTRVADLASSSQYGPSTAGRGWSRLFNSLQRPYDYVIFISWFARGGAELVAANWARFLVETAGPHSVLVVCTDRSVEAGRAWFPAGADLIDMPALAPGATAEDRVDYVEALVSVLRPKSVVNVNSRACWDAYRRRGRALSVTSTLYATIFCRDFSADGVPGGYADTHLRDCLPDLTAIVFDNATFIAEVTGRLALPDSLAARLHFVPQPISPGNGRRAYHRAASGTRIRVLWTGRLCRQKNIDVLKEILRSAIEFDFDIYGAGDDQHEAMIRGLAADHAHIRYKGGFDGLASVPVEEYGAYLFTSSWEGLPMTLVDVAAMGLPVIASIVGGVGELIDPSTGWPITDVNRAESYIDALRALRADPEETEKRAERLALRAFKRHSWAAYHAAMTSVSPADHCRD